MTVVQVVDVNVSVPAPVNVTVGSVQLAGSGGTGAVDSVNGHTGVVVLDAADVGADASGAAAAAVAGIPSNAAAGTASLRSLGTTGTTAAAGNDGRLSDARTPTAHAASHASAGSDPVTLAQSQVTGLTTALAGKVANASGQTLTLWVGTAAAYTALGTYDSGTVYVTT